MRKWTPLTSLCASTWSHQHHCRSQNSNDVSEEEDRNWRYASTAIESCTYFSTGIRCSIPCVKQEKRLLGGLFSLLIIKTVYWIPKKGEDCLRQEKKTGDRQEEQYWKPRVDEEEKKENFKVDLYTIMDVKFRRLSSSGVKVKRRIVQELVANLLVDPNVAVTVQQVEEEAERIIEDVLGMDWTQLSLFWPIDLP